MIEAAVSHVATELDRHLGRRFGAMANRVVLSPLFEQDGTVPNRIDDKLVMLLVNIEKDTVARSGPSPGSASHRQAPRPALHLNLHLLLAANFGNGNYAEALRFISDAASFFQRRPVMTHADSPGLDPRIERLTLDIENLTFSELSNLWGVLGGRYLPSILYKMRMITIDSDEVRGERPPIREPAIAAAAGADR